MRIPLLRTLPMLVVAGAIATGGGDVPTATARPMASLDTRTPLSIELLCEPFYCMAYASGGSGTGYSFTWLGAFESADGNGYSDAYVAQCPNGGTGGYRKVTATLTDSSGATVSKSAYSQCYGPIP